jgi:hypothetical protein
MPRPPGAGSKAQHPAHGALTIIKHSERRVWASRPVRRKSHSPSKRERATLMQKKLIEMTIGLGVMVLAAQQVSAQQTNNCAPRDRVVAQLAGSYGETRQSIGLASNNTLVEVYASNGTGSWTITVTTPGGVTCLIASGQSFETLAEALPANGNDA